MAYKKERRCKIKTVRKEIKNERCNKKKKEQDLRERSETDRQKERKRSLFRVRHAETDISLLLPIDTQ